MEITLAIALIGCVISVANFVIARKDKAVSDTKDNHQELIEYQLKELKEDVRTILSKIERYEKDIKEQVKQELELHVKMYHSKGENK